MTLQPVIGVIINHLLYRTSKKVDLIKLNNQKFLMKNRFTLLFSVAAIVTTLGMHGCSKSQPEPPAAPLAAPLAATDIDHVADMHVTEHVMTMLHKNKVLKGSNIQVVTLKGDVRLIGTLDSQSQIDEAIKIVRASDGAHTIHNELTIRK